MQRLSIRLRLLLAGAAGVLLALVLAGWGLAVLFDRHVERVAASDLQDRLEHVAAAVEMSRDGALTMPDPPSDPVYQRPYSGQYWQIEAPGARLRSRSLWDYALPLPAGLRSAWRGALPGPAGETLLAVARPIHMAAPGGNVAVHVAVAIDRAKLDAARVGFLSDLTPMLVLLALALVGALAMAVAVALRPLSAIGRRVAALSNGQAQRIGSEVPAEVLPLAVEIDGLLDAREAEVERARFRAGDLAHGLKTPLQALMGEAARLRIKEETLAAAGIEEIVHAIRTHLDRELARARRTAEGIGSSDPVEVATSIAAVLRRTPEGARLRIDVEGTSSLTVRLHRADLAEALGAVAENAVRHARSHVVIACKRERGQVTIRVRDDGPGVDPANLDQLPARGVRLDEQGEGSGLGLAIAAEVALAAGGSLRLHNLDEGFEAEISLPGLTS